MSRVPIRARLAAVFALAMAAVLFAAGWLVYARVASDLARSLETIRGAGYRLRADGGA